MGFWFAGLYQDWLPGFDALIMGDGDRGDRARSETSSPR